MDCIWLDFISTCSFGKAKIGSAVCLKVSLDVFAVILLAVNTCSNSVKTNIYSFIEIKIIIVVSYIHVVGISVTQ